MNTRKLIVKISYSLIATLIIVVVGLLVYQQRLIRQMSDNEQQAPSAAAISDSNTQADNNKQTTPVAEGGMEQLAAQLEEEIDSLEYQLEASEEELDMTREDLANKKGLDEQRQEVIAAMEREYHAMQRKRLENPTLRNMMRRETENSLGETYGALFEKLGLPDEKTQAFKTMLVDREMHGQVVMLDMMDQSLPEEEKKEIREQVENAMSEFEKQASDLLGAENYGAYMAYVERIQERQFVDGPYNTLSADLGLSNEKEWALIDAMYEARMEVLAEDGIDFSDPQTFIRNEGPREEMDRQLRIFDGYLESAQGVLSESQAEQFEARINEEKEMIKIDRELMEGGDGDSQ